MCSFALKFTACKTSECGCGHRDLEEEGLPRKPGWLTEPSKELGDIKSSARSQDSPHNQEHQGSSTRDIREGGLGVGWGCLLFFNTCYLSVLLLRWSLRSQDDFKLVIPLPLPVYSWDQTVI